MKNSVSIIDYGVGNVASVINMIKYLGGNAQVISNPKNLDLTTKLIFPGVGAFDHAIESLQKNCWFDALNLAVLEKNVPILGICLGMQLMCKSSEEGRLPGLGWIDAQVKRFDLVGSQPQLKVPHMGWNYVEVINPNPLILDETNNHRFYFVHSYYVDCAQEQDIILKANYGIDFVAGFASKNIYGVQFHPEKSHRFGKDLIKHFLDV